MSTEKMVTVMLLEAIERLAEQYNVSDEKIKIKITKVVTNGKKELGFYLLNENTGNLNKITINEILCMPDNVGIFSKENVKRNFVLSYLKVTIEDFEEDYDSKDIELQILKEKNRPLGHLYVNDKFVRIVNINEII